MTKCFILDQKLFINGYFLKNGYFEKLQSNIDKYFHRINGFEITLVEFVIHYDYCGSEESRQIIKLKNKTNFEVEDSEIVSAYSKEAFLPELIFTRNGEVMKLRGKRKVLTYPKFDEDDVDRMIYSKVLMFMPLRKEPNTIEEVKHLYSKFDDPPVDVDGSTQLTIIQRVERCIFQLF